jgi:hypothetical protein
MSIQHRRPAAGQWTAAYTRDDALQLGRYRRKRLASWLLIVPTLAFFSLSLVAGAQAFGKTDYASAIKELPPSQPVIVVAKVQQSFDNPLAWLSDYGSKEVCSVTSSQLSTIAAHYQVGHMAVDVAGARLDVVTVEGAGANDHELRTYLGDPKLKCQLVRRGGVFFLPFDAHGS